MNKVEVAEKRGMDVLLKYKARLEESKVIIIRTRQSSNIFRQYRITVNL